MSLYACLRQRCSVGSVHIGRREQSHFFLGVPRSGSKKAGQFPPQRSLAFMSLYACLRQRCSVGSVRIGRREQSHFFLAM